MPGYRSRTRKKTAADARKGKPSAGRKHVAEKIAKKVRDIRKRQREEREQQRTTDTLQGHASPTDHTAPLGVLPAMDLGAPSTVTNGALHAPAGTPTPPVQTTAQALAKLGKKEREKVAYNLRIAGHDYRTIAEHLGITVKTAYYDVQNASKYLREHERVLAEDVKAIIISRNDAMIAYLWPKVEMGDTFAVREVRGIHQDTAKLLGLNAPEQIDLNVRRPLREASGEELSALADRLRQARPIPGSVLSTSRPLRLIDGKTGQPVDEQETDQFTDEEPETNND